MDIRRVNARHTSTVSHRTRREHASHGTGGFERVIAFVNLASTVVVGVGTIVLAVVSIRLTSDFNEWQKSWAAFQAAGVKENEVNDIGERLKDRCIVLAELGFNAAERLDTLKAREFLNYVSRYEPRCSKVGVGTEIVTAALVVKRPKNFDDATVARAVLIVEQATRLRQATSPSRGAAENAIETFDPKLVRSNADMIINDTLNGRSYKNSSQANISSMNSDAEYDEKPKSQLDEQGVSISWVSPMGPINFDISKILKKEEYDRTENFHFSTATRFQE